MRVDDLVGAIWLPADGKANPTDLTFALAKGARMRGTRVIEKTRVLGILTHDGRVTGVRTDAGDVEAEIVVNCAGQWAKQVGAMAGVNVPLHSAEHFYVVTEHIDGVHTDLPILRDPDGYTYFKEEVGGLVIGGFEPEAKPWVAPDEIPYPFEFQLLEEDWDHFEILMNNALLRIPALEETGIKKFYNGPESFTPDNQFILGEAPELDQLLRRRRIQLGRHRDRGRCGPGAGGVDRQRLRHRRPHRRRHPPVRAVQRQQPLAARPGRRGPRAALRNPLAQPGDDDRSTVPPLPGASPAGGRERQLRQQDGLGARQLLRARRRRPDDRVHLGQAELAAVVGGRADQHPHRRHRFRSDVVLEVPDGRDPTPRRRCSGCAPPTSAADVGKTVYTGMLNERGTYESDVTVTRTGAEEFLIVSSAATTERDKDHIRKNLPAGARASLVDVTSAYAVFGVMGPRSRDLLATPDRRRPVRRRVPVRHQPTDLAGVRDRAGDADHLRRRTRLGTLRARRIRRRRVRGPDGRRASRSGSAAAATTRSNRCDWRRATAPSVAN